MSAVEPLNSVAGAQVRSHRDLLPGERPHEKFLQWCRERRTPIAAMTSGRILLVDLAAREAVQLRQALINDGLTPKFVLASKKVIDELLEDKRSTKLSSEEKTDAQKLLRRLVADAIEARASDIHLEIRNGETRVRRRRRGLLEELAPLTEAEGRALAVASFYRQADQSEGHWNPNRPNKASVDIDGLDLQNTRIDARLRLQSIPDLKGFDLILRVLANQQLTDTRTLTDLGFGRLHAEILENAMRYPHGGIVIAGPTGSGKTTTLAALLRDIPPTAKAYSLEDPVEIDKPHVTQVPVNAQIEDLDFAAMAAAILRADPDIVVIGECRERRVAAEFATGAISGHLVLTTLHANSSTAIITRFADLGIAPSLLADPNLFRCLVYQRLVPRLCPHCSIPITQAPGYAPTIERLASVFGDDIDRMRARYPDGCAKCDYTGTENLTVCAEVTVVDRPSLGYIARGDIAGWEHYLRDNGWEDIQQHAYHLVRYGLVDPLSAELVIGPFTKDTAAPYSYQAHRDRIRARFNR